MDNPSDQLMNRYTKHTMEYDSLINENEVLLCAATWMNFINMLSKKSQLKKATSCIIPPVCNVQKRQIYRDRKICSFLGLRVEMGMHCKWA